MRRLKIAVILSGIALCCLLPLAAGAKNSKPVVPPYVLRAHTVAVMIDPEAGISLEDPNANQRARKDVETAILNWGRFTIVLAAPQADLVIVLRKGHNRMVDETISDSRQNSRPGVINPTSDGVSIGAQHGPQPGLSSSPTDATRSGNEAHPQLEVGDVDDSFAVYEGQKEHPLDFAPGWQFVRKDGLHPHDVPAVDEFRKAIVEAEKQAAKQAAKHP